MRLLASGKWGRRESNPAQDFHRCARGTAPAASRTWRMPTPDSLGGQESALEGGSVAGRPVRREHELDRQLEQWAQRLEDLLGRHALVRPVGRELEAPAAFDERVAGDERLAALDPEQEVVRLHPRERLDPDRQPVAGPEHLSLDRVRGAPVRRGHEQRRAETLSHAPPVAGVPRARQHDRRVAFGRELVDQARRSQRIEKQQPLAVVDRVRRNHWAPVLLRLPVRMRRLPVPQTWLNLAHNAMVSDERRRPIGVLAALRCMLSAGRVIPKTAQPPQSKEHLA